MQYKNETPKICYRRKYLLKIFKKFKVRRARIKIKVLKFVVISSKFPVDGNLT